MYQRNILELPVIKRLEKFTITTSLLFVLVGPMLMLEARQWRHQGGEPSLARDSRSESLGFNLYNSIDQVNRLKLKKYSSKYRAESGQETESRRNGRTKKRTTFNLDQLLDWHPSENFITKYRCQESTPSLNN